MSDDFGWLEGKPETVTRDELARLLDVPTAEITKWLKQGCPSEGERTARRFVVSKVVRWLLEQRGEGRDDPKRRAQAAVAELREMEVKQRRGELINTAETARRIAGHVADLQTEFLTAPARANLPPDLAEAMRGELIISINKFAKAADDATRN